MQAEGKRGIDEGEEIDSVLVSKRRGRDGRRRERGKRRRRKRGCGSCDLVTILLRSCLALDIGGQSTTAIAILDTIRYGGWSKIFGARDTRPTS